MRELFLVLYFSKPYAEIISPSQNAEISSCAERPAGRKKYYYGNSRGDGRGRGGAFCGDRGRGKRVLRGYRAFQRFMRVGRPPCHGGQAAQNGVFGAQYHRPGWQACSGQPEYCGRHGAIPRHPRGVKQGRQQSFVLRHVPFGPVRQRYCGGLLHRHGVWRRDPYIRAVFAGETWRGQRDRAYPLL